MTLRCRLQGHVWKPLFAGAPFGGWPYPERLRSPEYCTRRYCSAVRESPASKGH